MDPATIAGLMQGASGILRAAQPTMPTAPNQRADGYSLGGMAEGSNSGGATGGAYGGAWSQANIDGSNWTVSLGGGVATGGGTSGGNGGLSPTQTGSTGGVAPSSPFSFGSGLDARGGMDLLPLIAVAVAVYLFARR